MLSGEPPNEKLVKMFFSGMEVTCDTLVTVWLKNKRFLCGNEISIADLLGACELEQPSMCFLHYNHLFLLFTNRNCYGFIDHEKF